MKEDIYYRSVFVFDVSQTNAKPEDLPQIFPNRPHNYDYSKVENRKALYNELVEIAEENNIHTKIATLDEWNSNQLGSVKGVFRENKLNGSKEIWLSPRLNDDEKIPVLIHELTHGVLHNQSEQTKRDKPLNKAEKEFQAELSSYITAKHYGIDTKEQAIPYISNWTQNLNEISDKDQIRDINEIQKVSRAITNRIDAKLFEEQKQTNSKKKETTANYRKFKDDIEKAKNADIVGVIERAGYHLKKESRNQYRGVEHDSLVVDVAKNRYFFNSRKLKGDPISFTQKVVGIEDFKQAVNFVNGLEVDMKQATKPKEKSLTNIIKSMKHLQHNKPEIIWLMSGKLMSM